MTRVLFPQKTSYTNTLPASQKMRIRKNILIIIILLICSCNAKTERQNLKQNSELIIESKVEQKKESESDNDYLISAELFAKEVLKENIRTHEFDLTKLEKPRHLRIFRADGLENIIAYSDKKYSKNYNLTYYEQFILFVATYENSESARKTFDRIKSDSKHEYWFELKGDLSKRVRALNIGAKPGGMITQNGKQIFSLVKTCRKVPLGANWTEYENRLLRYLTRTGNEEFGVLHSGCGYDKYEYKTIKVSR